MTNLEYRIIDINEKNVDEYDLLCVKSRKSSDGYQKKLKWFKDRCKEGMRFKLLHILERGKFTSRGMLEYIPGEYTWRAIDAKGYMVIHCIWIVGRNKKRGYGSKLLEECYKDSQGMNGVAVVTSKNGHWLPKPKLFKSHGFEVADMHNNNFELYVKRFKKETKLPKFQVFKRNPKIKDNKGLTILHSDQCPYTTGAIRTLAQYAKTKEIPLEIIPISNNIEAQNNGYTPYGTYCVLYNNEYLSYYYQNEKRLDKLIEDKRE